MKTKELITLCAVCFRAYRDGTNYCIRRTKKNTREICDYCHYRMGLEYEMQKRKKGGGKNG